MKDGEALDLNWADAAAHEATSLLVFSRVIPDDYEIGDKAQRHIKFSEAQRHIKLALERRMDAQIVRDADDLRELRENTLLQLGVNPIFIVDGMEDQSIRYLIGGLLERIAELEAAAQEWRPVTEKPQDNQPHEIMATAIYNADDNLWDVFVGDIHMDWIGGNHPAVKWRPLPQPPTPARSE